MRPTCGLRQRWESYKSYSRLEKSFTIPANARSIEQCQLWTEYLLIQFQGDHDLCEWINTKCSTSSWRSHFYWGATGSLGVANCHTTNSTESFNEAVRNTWMRRSITSLARLIARIKSPQMEVELREGCDLQSFKVGDFHTDLLSPYGKDAIAMNWDSYSAFGLLSERHWIPDYERHGGQGGQVFFFDGADQENIDKLVSGINNPFEEGYIGCLTFVPHGMLY